MLKWSHFESKANAENPAQLYQLIAAREELDWLVWGQGESADDIEWKPTLHWYQNPIAVVWYILGHPLFKNCLT